jgi:hypothetical protein
MPVNSTFKSGRNIIIDTRARDKRELLRNNLYLKKRQNEIANEMVELQISNMKQINEWIEKIKQDKNKKEKV